MACRPKGRIFPKVVDVWLDSLIQLYQCPELIQFYLSETKNYLVNTDGLFLREVIAVATMPSKTARRCRLSILQ